MSAIQKELTKTLDIDAPKKAADRPDFLVDVIRGITKLTDAQWNSMSAAAQNWFNEAVDAKNAKATIPEFPDFEAEEEAPARRRAAADDEAPKGGTKVEVKEKDLKAGMPISLTTLRGKEDTGIVIEVVKGILAIKHGDGEEVEYDLERIDKMYTLATEEKEEGTRRRRSAEDDEPADPIKVGATVKVTTKRGKEETGEIIELDEKTLVLKVGKEELEYTRSNLESVTPVGGAKEETTTRRRSADSDKDSKSKGDEDGKTKRASNDGVSVGQRISELILDDMKATEEDIAKALKKEGLEFRENTLKLNFKSTHKFLDLLKERKLLK